MNCIKWSNYLRLLTLAHSNISQTRNGPTLLTSAGAIVLLIFSTAFETPARDKQTMTDPDWGRPCRAGETDDHRAPHPILCGCFWVFMGESIIYPSVIVFFIVVLDLWTSVCACQG